MLVSIAEGGMRAEQKAFRNFGFLSPLKKQDVFWRNKLTNIKLSNGNLVLVVISICCNAILSVFFSLFFLPPQCRDGSPCLRVGDFQKFAFQMEALCGAVQPCLCGIFAVHFLGAFCSGAAAASQQFFTIGALLPVSTCWADSLTGCLYRSWINTVLSEIWDLQVLKIKC